jgi:hypothetical protein
MSTDISRFFVSKFKNLGYKRVCIKNFYQGKSGQPYWYEEDVKSCCKEPVHKVTIIGFLSQQSGNPWKKPWLVSWINSSDPGSFGSVAKRFEFEWTKISHRLVDLDDLLKDRFDSLLTTCFTQLMLDLKHGKSIFVENTEMFTPDKIYEILIEASMS